jgi:hypothetical protein
MGKAALYRLPGAGRAPAGARLPRRGGAGLSAAQRHCAPHDPLADTKERIHDWAAWYRRRHELGYPPHSWEGRAHLRGGSAPRPEEASGPEPTNPVHEETERHVCAMEPALRDAVKCKHLWRLNNGHGARLCHCSRSEYRERLNRAYWWLKGALGC